MKDRSSRSQVLLAHLALWGTLLQVTSEAGLSLPGINTPPVIVLQRKWKIPADERVGVRIERVQAKDAEQDTLTYRLRPGPFLDGSSYFRIDSRTGEIFLNRSLEDQAGAQFYLYVTAYDGGYESKMEVFVEVTAPDGRTQPPVFPPAFTTTRSVTAPPIFREPFHPSSNQAPAIRPPNLTNRHPFSVGEHPELIGNTHTVYEYVPASAPDAGTSGVVTNGVSSGNSNRDLGLDLTATILPILAIIGFSPLVGLLLWLLRRKGCLFQKSSQKEREKEKKPTEMTVSLETTSTEVSELDSDLTLPPTPSAYEPLPPWSGGHQARWEFPRAQLKLQGVLGEGCFGQVWKCEAWNISGLEGVTTVAVKTLKENAGERETKDLLSELDVMKALDPHPNVVRLLGSCTEKDPIYVIMEYVPFGKLQTYLRNNRAEHYYKNLHGSSKSLTSQDLTSFAYNVARGMDFLSSKGIIHRDLAARNVLVGEDKVCKVADFGFARDVESSHIYERKSEGRLPIRWMAPESLFDNVFSVKTDVWSFGILMWEIVTLGSTPYPGMAANEVMQKVREGHRLDKPDHCKREMYNIMYYCWDRDPDQRPSFSELAQILEQLLVSDTDYIELERFPDHFYYNVTSPSSERL